MSGDVRVVRTSGDLALQTASGDLVVEGATGRLTAQTASGDLRVASAQIEGFHIQTANGDILLDALLTGAGPFRAHTASGDVRLTLRRSAAGGEDPAVSLALPDSLRRRPRAPAVSQDRPPALAGRFRRQRTAHRGHNRQRRPHRRVCCGGAVSPRPLPTTSPVDNVPRRHLPRQRHQSRCAAIVTNRPAPPA